MGFPERYKLNAMSSGAAKAQPRLAFSTRCSLIGESMSVYCLSSMLATLAVQFGFLGRMPSRREVGERQGCFCVTGSHARASNLLEGRDRIIQMHKSLWLGTWLGLDLEAATFASPEGSYQSHTAFDSKQLKHLQFDVLV